MKKIELNAPLRFVLVILIWLLTFTVVNFTGTLANGGAGLIGTLVLYVGALYLAFVYFNDCALKKACKLSLIVMSILIVCTLVIQCYGYTITLIDNPNKAIIKTGEVLNVVLQVGRNLTLAICLLVTLITTLNAPCDCKCECKKEEAKEVEAPKEEKKATKKEAEKTEE